MSYDQRASKAQKSMGQRVIGLIFLVMFLWAFALIPLGLLSFGAGSPTGLRWATCHVLDATAEETADPEAPWRLVLESTNCPILVYTDGITADNADGLASTFEQAPYEVRVHESAIDADGGVRYAKELEMHSYRPAPAQNESSQH